MKDLKKAEGEPGGDLLMARTLDEALVNAVRRTPTDPEEIVCVLARMKLRGCHVVLGYEDAAAHVLARGVANSVRQADDLLRVADGIADLLRSARVTGQSSPKDHDDRRDRPDGAPSSESPGPAPASVHVLPRMSSPAEADPATPPLYKRHKTYNLDSKQYDLSERALDLMRLKVGRDITDREAYVMLCEEVVRRHAADEASRRPAA